MYKFLLILLAILGVILPYWNLIPWMMSNGVNIPLMFSQLFSTRIGSFFGFDLIIAATTFIVFVFSDSRRLKVKNYWIAIACTFAVGVSLGFPVYLLLREKTKNN